jgi:hypothetical protein
MLVGKDQHAQASGRGRGREEKQAGTLQDHQGGEGGRRNRQEHCKIIITGRGERGLAWTCISSHSLVLGD